MKVRIKATFPNMTHTRLGRAHLREFHPDTAHLADNYDSNLMVPNYIANCSYNLSLRTVSAPNKLISGGYGVWVPGQGTMVWDKFLK